ncbi:PDDEXK-like family protein [Psychroserpens luteus]|uniref:PD-(D/E)XK nuclease family protein n=1 Tax=Psychroserpens luteus TaxID=1434066 RepID=A0ABW5ZS88_9FLAO|nr:PD-(D/E)XK nuclease family protein [Psychroserpens luteus]
MNYTNTLLSEVQTIVNSYSRINKMSGQNFNLFTLLRKGSDEVRLHSKFISELLNPQGSHQQGTLFLDCFLTRLSITDFETNNATANIEYYTGVINDNKDLGGNIDILIRSINNKVIKIENKIYAKEQENQLLRYHNFQKDGQLIFLTLRGHKSRDHDTLTNAKIDYQQISYKNEITEWLQECIEKCATVPIVRESIVQYLNLVKKLTHQNINKKMSKEIVEKITQSKESFEAYLAIRKTENDNEMYFDVANSHLIPFFEDFAVKNNLTVKNLEKSLIEKRERYSGFFFTNDTLTKYGLKLSIQFGNSLNRDMFYGLSFTTENPEEHAVCEIIAKEAKHVMDKPNPTNSWWLCNTFWKEYRNWGEIETLYNLAYGNFQNELSSKLTAILNLAFSVIENYESQLESKSKT